jgi:hypothetical protein
LPQRIGEEKASRGKPLETLCARKNDCLGRQPCFCDVLQIQTLRWQFDRKLPTGKTHASKKAKVFAVCDARYDRRNFKQDGKQKNLLSLPAAREGFI